MLHSSQGLRQRRQPHFYLLLSLCVASTIFLAPAAEARSRHTLDRAPLLDADGETMPDLVAVLGIDREIYLEAVSQEGEDIARLARRLCGDASAAKPISVFNQLSGLEPGTSVRVPLALLTPELQIRTVRALFPQDRLRAGHWEHWVQNGSRRGLETAWRIARWFTGNGENAPELAKVNRLAAGPLGSGTILRIPQELLLPGLRPGASALPADQSAVLAESLEYLYDGTGLHAVYRLRPGEAIEAALRRLTKPREEDAVEVMTAEIASLNGIVDPLALPTGYEIKIPANELRADLRAPDQLWLPTPVARPGLAGGQVWNAASPRDFLIGLGVAAPHEITNLDALLSGGGGGSFSTDPHDSIEPGRGRVSSKVEVTPSDLFPDLDVLPYTLWIDGRRQAEIRAFAVRDSGVLLLPFDTIADALGHRYRLDTARRHLVVERAPDGASLSLNMQTGLVIANRRAAGVAPNIGDSRLDPLLLPLEATEAMTGAHIRRDDDRREIRVELDNRLRAVFGFDVLVEGQPLLFLDPEPRAVGSVLLLPLRSIAEELGNEVIVDRTTQTVRVIRAQDNATIVLELGTGVVRVNDWAAGMVPNMTYADIDALLLPQPAVEALTGTHVTVEAGTRRITVDLDPRLRDLVGPRGDILAEVRNEGFVAERLDVRLGNDIPNEVRFRGRFRDFSLQARYETAGWPETGAAFDPLWAELQFESLRGFGGMLGDYSASRRELRGVDLARVRGAAWRQDFEDGQLRVVAGQPVRGSRQIGDNLAIPEFDDLAVGGRYYSGDGRYEIGLAALDDDNSRKIVGSVLHRFDAPEFRLGALRSHQEVDLGFFDGTLYDGTGTAATGDEGQDLDLRARWNAHLRPTPTFSVSTQARYQGLQFNRARQTELQIEEAARDGMVRDPLTGQDIPAGERLEQELGGDTDRLDVRVNMAYQPLPELAFGARAQVREDGVFEGVESDMGSIASWGLNLTTQPFAKGPRVSVDYSESDPSGALSTDAPNEELRVDMTQRLGRWQLFAHHEAESGDGQRDRELTSLSLRAQPFVIELPKASAFLFTPGIRGYRTDDLERADLDVFAEWRSGRLFGRRFDMRLAYARSLAVELDNEDRDDYQETLSAVARYKLRDDLAIEASYINNLRTDDDRFLVRLRAGIDFSPQRKFKLPNQGTGVLTGFAFLDQNQDGVYQPGEPALPGVGVWIRGRRLGLKTDRMGRFTIQNLRAGPYELEVDLENLPLGLLPYLETLPRLSVGDGDITHIEIPMILSGQVRGALFADANGNGQRDPDEQGLEGIKVTLEPVDDVTRDTFTTFFGQFAFDRLRSGRYKVHVDEEFLPEGLRSPIEAPEVEIVAGGELMQRVELGLRPVAVAAGMPAAGAPAAGVPIPSTDRAPPVSGTSGRDTPGPRGGETPAEDVPVDARPTEDIPTEDVSMDDVSVQDVSMQDVSMQDRPGE